MSDDTTTWLKKNTAMMPLRRSLKTSLRIQASSSDMNSSIMSNLDKVKDHGLFIPRMLQRTNMQMRKSRPFDFKVPELLAKPKPAGKEGSGVKPKKIPTPSRVRKSFLPVPKTVGQSHVKPAAKKAIPRPSVIPGASDRRTAKRELMRKVAELSEMKRKEEAESEVKIVSEDSSVLRSILKKRASLRRTSQISSKKSKAKKVLFDGFENSDGEKENNPSDDFHTALDEPTVFLNFPNGGNFDESVLESDRTLNWTVEETKDSTADVRNILKLWESYKENLQIIQTERNSVEESFQCLLQSSLTFQKQYESYRERSEELYDRLSSLGREIEENLKMASGGGVDTPKTKKPGAKRGSDKVDKIKVSDRSKMIKKNSGRKSVPLLKKELLKDLEDSFNILVSSKSNILDN